MLSVDSQHSDKKTYNLTPKTTTIDLEKNLSRKAKPPALGHQVSGTSHPSFQSANNSAKRRIESKTRIMMLHSPSAGNESEFFSVQQYAHPNFDGEVEPKTPDNRPKKGSRSIGGSQPQSVQNSRRFVGNLSSVNFDLHSTHRAGTPIEPSEAFTSNGHVKRSLTPHDRQKGNNILQETNGVQKNSITPTGNFIPKLKQTENGNEFSVNKREILKLFKKKFREELKTLVKEKDACFTSDSKDHDKGEEKSTDKEGNEYKFSITIKVSSSAKKKELDKDSDRNPNCCPLIGDVNNFSAENENPAALVSFSQRSFHTPSTTNNNTITENSNRVLTGDELSLRECSLVNNASGGRALSLSIEKNQLNQNTEMTFKHDKDLHKCNKPTELIHSGFELQSETENINSKADFLRCQINAVKASLKEKDAVLSSLDEKMLGMETKMESLETTLNKARMISVVEKMEILKEKVELKNEITRVEEQISMMHNLVHDIGLINKQNGALNIQGPFNNSCAEGDEESQFKFLIKKLSDIKGSYETKVILLKKEVELNKTIVAKSNEFMSCFRKETVSERILTNSQLGTTSNTEAKSIEIPELTPSFREISEYPGKTSHVSQTTNHGTLTKAQMILQQVNQQTNGLQTQQSHPKFPLATANSPNRIPNAQEVSYHPSPNSALELASGNYSQTNGWELTDGIRKKMAKVRNLVTRPSVLNSTPLM